MYYSTDNIKYGKYHKRIENTTDVKVVGFYLVDGDRFAAPGLRRTTKSSIPTIGSALSAGRTCAQQLPSYRRARENSPVNVDRVNHSRLWV
eukprot:SAG11_NODE_3945_length_2137_cov_10.152601_2_plen_91_part_00